MRATWVRRIQRLATFGRLHKELVPFLWPDGEPHGEVTSLSKNYWTWTRKHDEGELWPRPVATSPGDYDRIVKLLEGCDILHRSGDDEYLAPALLADTQRDKMDARAFARPDGCVAKQLRVSHLPDGFFSRLLVRMARDYSHLDFAGTVAALYDRALKLQVFVTNDNVKQDGDQLNREVTTLHIFASTKQQVEQVENHVRQLHQFFTGLIFIAENGQPSHALEFEDKSGDVQEPIQVRVIQATKLGLYWRKLSRKPEQGIILEHPELKLYLDKKPWKQKHRADITDPEWESEHTDTEWESEHTDTEWESEHKDRAEITDTEWESFHISNLSVDHYIASDSVPNTFYAPLDTGFSSISTQIQTIIDKIDNKLSLEAGSKWHAKEFREKKWSETYANRLRVVLVCMEPQIATDTVALAQFRVAVAAGLVIIPLICPGYDIHDYSRWWPDEMPEMHKHALFVDLRGKDGWVAKVKNELLPQINKFLNEWRGKAPDPAAFEAAADRIMCVQCSEKLVANPHYFSRKECQLKLDTVVKARSEEREVIGDIEAMNIDCEHGHQMSLTEILSRNVILEAVPCPNCVQCGHVPPHCFNRQDCLLYFSEDLLNSSRAGAINCPCCASSIRVLDIVVPEVFLSYNWGVFDPSTNTFSTQSIVSAMRRPIEHGADVVTWFDVGGGMGAGQSVKKEMQQGVLKSTVVVIFLSDAYCKSGNCVREFLHATRHSKFLIVVLVPFGPDKSGWTGPGADNKDWWQHATECSDCKDPDTGKPFSWSTLAQFTPIDLRVKDGASEKEAQDFAVFEIVKRIMSRFHRGERIQHTAATYDYCRKLALFDSLAARADDEDGLRSEAKALFDMLDINKDGAIDKSELLKGFPQLEDQTADLIMAEADVDGNESISFEELFAAIQFVRLTGAQIGSEGTAVKGEFSTKTLAVPTLNQDMQERKQIQLAKEEQNECEEASGQITLASVYATSRDGVKEDDDAVGGFQHRMMMPLEDSNIDPTSNARYDRHVSTKTSSSCCTLC